MEIYDIIIIAAVVVISAVLWWLAGYAEKVRNSRWRLCWLTPAALVLVLAYISGFESLMIPAYIGAVLMILGLVFPDIHTRRKSSVTAAVMAFISLPLCLFNKWYRSVDYVKDFNTGFESMKAHYVLSEHKGVDWDELYDRYLPQFKQVYEKQDAVENEILWEKFCCEFNDLHVNYASDEEIVDKAHRRASGNDYGLVIVTLSDGRTVAAQVDESLASKGIHEGTEIISWNGLAPGDADKNNELYSITPFADEDNRKFFEGWFAAGTGGDTAEVCYMDDDGKEQTITLKKLEASYYDRYDEAYTKVADGMKVGHMTLNKLNDTTACLRIKFMSFDSVSEKEKHQGMKEELRQQILELKQQGIRDIVIDLRCNTGGSGTMVKAIAELFAPEGEHYYVSDAYFDRETKSYIKETDGKYKVHHDIVYNGDNILGDDGRVVLLVSDHSVSASDHMTHVLNELDNVTVMGFTESSGSAQGVSPIKLESGFLSYSSSLMLNKDGTVFIDCDDKMQSDISLDIKVPFDEKAFDAIFKEDKDYLMDESIKLLENMQR
ncbi:MAG: peptidase S41 [Ruminococcus sp.]|nr:peptidase S41 [Ruminococcus sp.]